MDAPGLCLDIDVQPLGALPVTQHHGVATRLRLGDWLPPRLGQLCLVKGSRFGRGDGRIAATAVGAGIGAMIGQGESSSQAMSGAAIGGLVGSRFGQGSGRLAATAIGAGLGAYLAVPKD